MRKFLKLIAFKVLLLSMTTLAYGWNCQDPLASRVDVGTVNPGGSTGDADGQYFLGTGSEGIKGDYYVCQVPKKPTPPTPTPTTSTSSSNSNSTSGATSTSGASATGGNSNSTATGGNSKSNATGGAGGNSTSNASGGAGGQGGAGGTGGSVGTVTAVGGNSAGGAGGNATGGNATGGKVANSGNSANTNKNTAKGGTVSGSGNSTNSVSNKQGQEQSTASSATGNGSNSNDTTNNTNVEATKIPVGTAYAPTAIPTAPCFKGLGGGVQTATAGLSFGGGKVDENCAILETARSFGISGSRLAYCKTMLIDKYAKKAGITLADCMAHELAPAPVVIPVAPVVPQQPTIIVVPMPAPVPVAVVPVPEPVLEGLCTRLDNVCKALLDDAINWKKQSQGVVIIYGSLTTYPTANAMREYLKHNGLASEDVRVNMSEKSTPVVGLGYLQQ